MTDSTLDTLTRDILQRVESPPVDPERGDAARADKLLVIAITDIRYAFSFAQLLWTTVLPNGDLYLRFSSHTVKVEGTGLAALQEALMRKQVDILEAKGNRYLGWGDAESEIAAVYVAGGDGRDEWVDDQGLIAPESEDGGSKLPV